MTECNCSCNKTKTQQKMNIDELFKFCHLEDLSSLSCSSLLALSVLSQLVNSESLSDVDPIELSDSLYFLTSLAQLGYK